jgi:hypothetical protein
MNMAVFWVVMQYCLVGYKLTDISDVLSAAVIRAVRNVRGVKLVRQSFSYSPPCELQILHNNNKVILIKVKQVSCLKTW